MIQKASTISLILSCVIFVMAFFIPAMPGELVGLYLVGAALALPAINILQPRIKVVASVICLLFLTLSYSEHANGTRHRHQAYEKKIEILESKGKRNNSSSTSASETQKNANVAEQNKSIRKLSKEEVDIFLAFFEQAYGNWDISNPTMFKFWTEYNHVELSSEGKIRFYIWCFQQDLPGALKTALTHRSAAVTFLPASEYEHGKGVLLSVSNITLESPKRALLEGVEMSGSRSGEEGTWEVIKEGNKWRVSKKNSGGIY
jgi:hypothetical protein